MPLTIHSTYSVLRGGFCVLFPPVFWSNIVRIRTPFHRQHKHEGPHVLSLHFATSPQKLGKNQNIPKIKQG